VNRRQRIIVAHSFHESETGKYEDDIHTLGRKGIPRPLPNASLDSEPLSISKAESSSHSAFSSSFPHSTTSDDEQTSSSAASSSSDKVRQTSSKSGQQPKQKDYYDKNRFNQPSDPPDEDDFM